jgi:hypothetical protein
MAPALKIPVCWMNVRREIMALVDNDGSNGYQPKLVQFYMAIC